MPNFSSFLFLALDALLNLFGSGRWAIPINAMFAPLSFWHFTRQLVWLVVCGRALDFGLLETKLLNKRRFIFDLCQCMSSR
jgi:membrane associated rhomboid family serine protease